MAAQPITCNRCHHTWTGLGAAHCASCCTTVLDPAMATFATANLFDAHRRETGERGQCLDPSMVRKKTGKHAGERVMFFRDGMWRGPEMTEADKAKAFGRAS